MSFYLYKVHIVDNTIWPKHITTHILYHDKE